MNENNLFQISIKGLVFNDEGKVLLLREKKGGFFELVKN